MASSGYSINKRVIAKMARDMQREFNKHPIQVPVEAASPGGVEGMLTSARDDLGNRLDAPATTNYFGPVINVHGDRAQLAWDNDSVVQGQDPAQQQIAPGFETIAAAVALTLRGLPAAGLPTENAEIAEAAATDVLAEVVKEAPDPGLVRRGVATLTGVLTSLALGMQKGASEATQEWAKTAIQQLGQS